MIRLSGRPAILSMRVYLSTVIVCCAVSAAALDQGGPASLTSPAAPLTELASPAAIGSAQPESRGRPFRPRLVELDRAAADPAAAPFAWRRFKAPAGPSRSRSRKAPTSWPTGRTFLPCSSPATARSPRTGSRRGASRGAYGIRVATSRDGGRTWTAPVIPHRDNSADRARLRLVLRRARRRRRHDLAGRPRDGGRTRVRRRSCGDGHGAPCDDAAQRHAGRRDGRRSARLRLLSDLGRRDSRRGRHRLPRSIRRRNPRYFHRAIHQRTVDVAGDGLCRRLADQELPGQRPCGRRVSRLGCRRLVHGCRWVVARAAGVLVGRAAVFGADSSRSATSPWAASAW